MNIPFDKIYCIHLSSEKDRLENILSEFNRIGIADRVNIWWTVRRKVSSTIGDVLKTLHTSYYDEIRIHNQYLYGAVFNCSFEHYTIIKQAYEREFKSILIMEDDIKFIEDVDRINTYFENMPKDYDVIRFWTTYHKTIDGHSLYELNNAFNTNSTLCYALSRNGMRTLLEEYDNSFGVADMVLNRIIGKCNFYTIKDIICYPNQDIQSCII